MSRTLLSSGKAVSSWLGAVGSKQCAVSNEYLAASDLAAEDVPKKGCTVPEQSLLRGCTQQLYPTTVPEGHGQRVPERVPNGQVSHGGTRSGDREAHAGRYRSRTNAFRTTVWYVPLHPHTQGATHHTLTHRRLVMNADMISDKTWDDVRCPQLCPRNQNVGRHMSADLC